MGHTKLFPRPTVAHNIACDAVINRGLLSTLRDAHADVPEMAALFVDYYDAATSPWFLLRPPPGWPRSPDWDASRNCPGQLREIHRRLYANGWDRGRDNAAGDGPARHTVMYSEIVAALNAAGLSGNGDSGRELLVRLLGGHGSTPLEQGALSGGRDALTAEALASVLAPVSGNMAGQGSDAFAHQVEKTARRAALERALGALIRRAFSSDARRRGPVVFRDRPARSADPSHGRRAPARVALARAFGAPRPLLFDSTVQERHVTPRDALVYLDVSGSMFSILPALHAALIPLRRELRPRIHAFSTDVVAIDALEFDRGLLPTTGGTSITPVLEHLLRDAGTSPVSRMRRTGSALVLTDGYFGSPDESVVRALTTAGMHVHLAIAGIGPLHDGAAWVATATRLPPL